MPLQSTLASQGHGLCLLSLDAGGTRGVSQLKILAELMQRLNDDREEDQELLPRDVFDMIGGSGSGGFIAILLVVLGLNAERALDEFIKLSVNILEKQEMEPTTRTAALRLYIGGLLKSHKIPSDMHLWDSNVRSKGSKLVTPILNKNHIGHARILRNFDADQDGTLNFTIADAMLATLASPPLFTPLSILNGTSTFQYISGDLTLSNPTLMIVSEAYETFGQEARVACLMNIGSGHPGLISPPDSSDLASWNQFLEKVVKDSEQKAQEIDTQMGDLGVYHRLSVTRGLEGQTKAEATTAGDAIGHTIIYLAEAAVSRKLDLCAKLLTSRDGIASLKRLKPSVDQSIPPPALPLPTRDFIMREKPWEFIEKMMLGIGSSEEIERPAMLVVTGMGGCGKTQLILKFIDVHKDQFAATFFIDGSSAPQIRADTIHHVRSLAVAHGLGGFENCLRFLAQPSPGHPRLLFYDNVDDPDIDLAPLLPLGGSCAIVITSRNRSLGELCREAHLELDVMSMDEAVDLLLHRPGHSTVISDEMRGEARSVAQALGCLPIALTQARSYMFQTQCSAGEYLQRLLNGRDKILAKPVKHHRDMRYVSTYAAFDASFALLTLRCQHLLRLLSFMHWSNFPLEIIVLAAKYNFAKYRYTYIDHGDEYYTGKAMLESTFLHEGEWDIAELDEMITSLQNHSLITITPGVGTKLVQMHPVAHGWVKSCIPEQESATYQSAAIVLLALGARNEYTPTTQYLSSHITHLSVLWDQLHVNSCEAFAQILNGGGSYEGALQLRERVVTQLRTQAESHSEAISDSLWNLALSYRTLGRLKDAAELQEEVLKLTKEILGELHPNTIRASSNLALTYSDQGRLKEAETLQEKALKLTKEILGESHPDTISASNDLANIYSSLGRLKEAETLREKVLKLSKEILGELHPDTIMASSNLALTYFDQGRLKEAETLQEKVLKLRKEILGELHPDTIMASSNLALTYFDQGRLKEAETLQEKALKLRKEILGESHPDTIRASSNLALTYSDQGRLKEAETLQEKALKLRKEILGESHPDTISASNDLANTYSSLGRLKEAETLREKVLKLRKEILGELHPDTIMASSNLALTYFDQGRLKEAETLQEKALKLRKEILGESHPDTIRASSNLALTYSDQGRLKEAETLQEKALKLRKEILGESHPDTISASNDLANTYSSLGRLKEAETLQEKALKLRKEILGESHPDTISASNDLANTYSSLGRLKEAETLQEKALKLTKEILGESHPDTISASNDLANIYSSLGRLKEAETLREKVLKLSKEILGELHPDTIMASSNLALTYFDQGRLKEAETLQEKALKLRKEILGELHPDTIMASNNLANTYSSLGRLKEAETLREKVLKLRKEILGELHPDTITASSNLALTYSDQGRLKEAETLQEKVLKLTKEILGELHPDTIMASNNLAITYFDQGRLKEAETLQADALRLRTEILGERHHNTAKAMLDMAETCHALGKKDQALQLATTANAIVSDTLGQSHPMYQRGQGITSRIQSEDNASSHEPRPSIPNSSSMAVASLSKPTPSKTRSRKRRKLSS